MLDCAFALLTMSSELAKLALLQDVDQQMSALTTGIAGFQQKISARESALVKTVGEADEAAKALAGESAARRRMESDTAD